jgi:hypothetical protein
LTVVAPSATAMILPAGGPSNFAGLTSMRLAVWIPLVLLGLIAFSRVKEQPRRLAWVGCFLVVAFLLAACNGGGGTGTTGGTGQTSQTYVVTVTGSSTAPAVQHTAQVTVVVQ